MSAPGKGQRKDKKTGLNPRQRAFADAYIADPSSPQAAAIKAGYAPAHANVQAQNLLSAPCVARYISERMPAADEERAREARKRIATGDEVNAFLSDVMMGRVKDAFGLDPGLSDRISAAKELRRIYDVADRYRATQGAQDDLSKSLESFIAGELAPDTEPQEPPQD